MPKLSWPSCQWLRIGSSSSSIPRRALRRYRIAGRQVWLGNDAEMFGESCRVAQRPVPLHVGYAELSIGGWWQIAERAVRPDRSGAGGDHFRILQWSVLLWTGNLGEQF